MRHQQSCMPSREANTSLLAESDAELRAMGIDIGSTTCIVCTRENGQSQNFPEGAKLVAHWRLRHDPSAITDDMLAEQDAKRCVGCKRGFVDLAQHVKRSKCSFAVRVLVGLDIAQLSATGEWERGRIVSATDAEHCVIKFDNQEPVPCGRYQALRLCFDFQYDNRFARQSLSLGAGVGCVAMGAVEARHIVAGAGSVALGAVAVHRPEVIDNVVAMGAVAGRLPEVIDKVAGSGSVALGAVAGRHPEVLDNAPPQLDPTSDSDDDEDDEEVADELPTGELPPFIQMSREPFKWGVARWGRVCQTDL